MNQSETDNTETRATIAGRLNLPCYVAVLTRGIPIDSPNTDTCTHVCRQGETVADIMEWAGKEASGSTWIVSVEITQAT